LQATTLLCDFFFNRRHQQLPGETGKFYSDGVEERSSVESYDCDLQKTVWRISGDLVHHSSGIVNEDLDDISVG
jgi:hypothetical protein